MVIKYQRFYEDYSFSVFLLNFMYYSINMFSNLTNENKLEIVLTFMNKILIHSKANKYKSFRVI